MGGLLDGKTAVVTGAGRGIGRAVSLLMAENGANLVVSDIDEDVGSETVALIERRGGSAVFVGCDVVDASQVARLMEAAERAFGGFAVLVNNAGYEGVIQPIVDGDDDDFDKVIAINLRGVYLGVKYGALAMRRFGKGGSIVNLASVAGLVGVPKGAPYVAAKHGVVGLSKTAALELAADGVRVNAVCPAIIRTRMAEESAVAMGGAPMEQLAAAMHPIGRVGEVDEVAQLILWLASDQSSFCTGGAYAVDGGFTAQ